MNAILLARFFPDHSLVIHNLAVIESRGTVSNVRRLSDRGELVRAVSELFGIPAPLTRVAVNSLERLEDAWN